jgi:hypothetical protein
MSIMNCHSKRDEIMLTSNLDVEPRAASLSRYTSQVTIVSKHQGVSMGMYDKRIYNCATHEDIIFW